MLESGEVASRPCVRPFPAGSLFPKLLLLAPFEFLYINFNQLSTGRADGSKLLLSKCL